MPKIIQNFALHPFDFPPALREDGTERPRMLFPAGVPAARGSVKPSETEVDEKDLAELKDHDIANVWFGPKGLVVKADAIEAPAEETEARPFEMSHPMGDHSKPGAADVRDEGDDAPIPGTEGGKFFTEASSPAMPWGTGPRPEGWPSNVQVAAAAAGEPVPAVTETPAKLEPAASDAAPSGEGEGK